MSASLPRAAALLLLLTVFGLAAGGCGDSASGGTTTPGGLSGKLVLTGSSTVAPLAAEIAARFEDLHPQVRIDVQTGGSSRGIADARSGAADLGMVSRALAPGERDLRAFALATDGVGLIVHAKNPVAGLSTAQVVAIYTGAIRRWREAGGGDAPITVVSKADGRATLAVFRAYFGLEPAAIRADVIIGDNQQGIKTVAGNPDAIGFVSIGAADYEARAGTPIKLLRIDGVEPTAGNVASGVFPIARPLNLVAAGEPRALAAAFLDFARSPRVRDLVEAQLFVPL